jgi:predicted ferric reductase
MLSDSRCDVFGGLSHRRGHMANHQVRLKKKEEIAEGTMAFYFEKPAGFQFKPGQFANLTLLNPPETDAEGNVRTFSIASAPLEEDLMFATRMRDTAFKRVLKSMPLGTEITLGGPFGSFSLHSDASRPGSFPGRRHRDHTFPQHDSPCEQKPALTPSSAILFQPPT